MNAIAQKYWNTLTEISLVSLAQHPSDDVIALVLHLTAEEARMTGEASVIIDTANKTQELAELTDNRNSWRSLAEGLKADVAGLHQRLAAALEQCDSQALRIVSLGAMVAEQPRYEEQQNRLMRWLIDNEPEASLACDADQGVAGAIIDILDKQRQTITNYDQALASAQNEAAMLRQQRADLLRDLNDLRQAQIVDPNTLQSQAIVISTNGASLDPTPTPDWKPSHPAWLGLAAEELETVAKLASGNLKFRNTPKPLRMILIGRVIKHIGKGDSKITMAQYNKHRPSWMAEATSITQYVESNKWQDVVATAMAMAAQ